MSSGSPNESTASRLERIGRRSDANDRQEVDSDFVEENIDEIEENDGVAGAAARGDFGVSEPNQELLEANCTDLEPDIEADVSSRNCSNVPWSASTQGEPSNFSQPWYQRRGYNSKQNQKQTGDEGEGPDENDDLLVGLASALERSGVQDPLDSARSNSLPPPINKQPGGLQHNRSRSPPPRRNTLQFAGPREPASGSQVAIGFHNWQSTKMTVKERISFLFNSSILSDVTFIVGRDTQQQRIPAHRFVLSVGSAVFDAMFNSTLATSDEEIPLPEVEHASFLALLKFLYSDEVQIDPETVMTTLYTAKKYAVPALEKHCVDFLKRHLCADNAFMLLTQARLFDEPQLAALCLETIDKNTPEALAAEGFTDIDINTLSAVLDRDSLRIKEAKLFGAVLKWSEAECVRQTLQSSAENKRAVLGRVLGQIRFPLMTVEEFAQGVAQSGILTDRECVSLFLHFTVNPKPPVGFLDVPRCSMTGKEQTVGRYQQIESRWGYSGMSDKIRFITDRRIYVVGFGLYGSIHGPCEYQVTIQIIHTGSERLLGSNEVSFTSDGSNSTFRVMFKEPIEITSNANYTASATLKGLDSYYGTKGMRKVNVECPGGQKVNFQFSYVAGNNNGTSVEDGQIPEIIFYT